MKSRRRSLLVAISILLLVPLGVAKWRADHPPLSTIDRRLRAAVDKVPWVYIVVYGKEWQSISRLDWRQSVVIQSKALLNELTTTLRCTDTELVDFGDTHVLDDMVVDIQIPPDDLRDAPDGYRQRWSGFWYRHNSHGSYLQPYASSAERTKAFPHHFPEERFVVQPHFASQFEVLIARLEQRAHSKGQHPDVTLKHYAWMH